MEVEAKPTRSTNIALNTAENVLVAVNTEANSVTIFNVSGTTLTKRTEVAVGRNPRCVAIHSTRNEAFVTNAESGTVSVIDLNPTNTRVVATIPVGAEPRPCALTPDGTILYVGNYSAGFVRAINPVSRAIVTTISVGGNPGAIAIVGDTSPARVFVTRFFAQLRGGGPGEGFDDGKQGILISFLTTAPGSPTGTLLSHLPNSGFTANRSAHCNISANPDPIKQTFCPAPASTNPTDPLIVSDIQAVFPNQFNSALICGAKLYLPNIGPQPEPPVFFNTNVQALVHVVDTNTQLQLSAQHVNLNAQIKNEVQPANPTSSLNRLFGNDLVAIDAKGDCSAFYIVSRGGNYVIRATKPAGPNGPLSIGVPNVVRFQTGNIPTGIVVDNAGARAFVYNDVNMSITVINLAANAVVTRDVDSSTPPVPGNFEHSRLMGKLVFHTALGTPNVGLTDLPLRNVVPLSFRGKQSDNAWSSCASCHPDGLADGVTWIFADGPRQTIPLDAYSSKINGAHDIRINNWSAARDSSTDFNNNSRNVQCGTGFAGGGTNTAIGCPALGSGAPNPAIFDHGISQGASDALDMETLWIQTIRALTTPKPDAATIQRGSIVFGQFCASCHGGAKWTKSQVIYLNNPTLNRAQAAGGTARDPGLTITANQIVSYSDPKVDANILKFLEIVGTFNAAKNIEIRQNGQTPLGVLGFNVPSLLGVGTNGPYFHDGAAQTLEASFPLHTLSGGGTIQSRLSAAQRTDLLIFLRAIDGRSVIVPNETDFFKDPTP
jgi:YVTN family beta-propeller protein